MPPTPIAFARSFGELDIGGCERVAADRMAFIVGSGVVRHCVLQESQLRGEGAVAMSVGSGGRASE